MSGNPFLDPRTGVFRNRLGITDRTELAAADVYPWAGHLGTVLIVKAGASFCLPHQIVDTASDVFGRLAARAPPARA